MIKKIFLLVFCFTILVLQINGLDIFSSHSRNLGTTFSDYIDYLSLTGDIQKPFLVFKTSSSLQSIPVLLENNESNIWQTRFPSINKSTKSAFAILPVNTDVIINTSYPYGSNDSHLWAGKGLTTSLDGGFFLNLGPLSLKFNPSIYYSQNLDFPLYTGYTLGGIDLPQRFGETAFVHYDWGQSSIRLDLYNFTLGFSTENMWIGPAVRNPILMSNNAPGFPHIDFGLGCPAFIGIGDTEFRFIWGALEESGYFDSDASNDRRLFTGFTIGYRPVFIPQLILGFNRIYYRVWSDSLTVQDFFPFLETPFKWLMITPENPTANDLADQMISLTFEWLFKEVNFSIYAEWARNDHAGNLRDLILEPDHSQAYMIGFKKSFSVYKGLLLLQLELIHLGKSITFIGRPTPSYYRHHIIKQGYTHLGQIIGSGSGPGSDSQYLGIDYYLSFGKIGIFFERLRFDEDTYNAAYAKTYAYNNHDVSLSAGVDFLYFLPYFDIGLGVTAIENLNRYYIFQNDVFNINLKFSFSFHG